MTKREYFAAKAMQGVLANPKSSHLKPVDVARCAIENAEALIALLNLDDVKNLNKQAW